MKGFKKLLLTSAILAASSSAFAMQALDEDTMSSTTGQDGLSIRIDSSNISNMDLTWVDRGGFVGYLTDGGVQITNLGLSLTNLDITVDAGSDAANGAQLNIGFATVDNVVISLNGGAITVGDASAVGSGTKLGGVPNTTMSGATDIITFNAASTITIAGGLSGSIKLGNRALGEHLMSLTTTNPFDVVLTGGLNILAGTGVGIGIGGLEVAQVSLNTNIDVTGGATGGLVIDNAGSSIGQVSLEDVKLGDVATAPDVGDIYLTGLTANSRMTIRGH